MASESDIPETGAVFTFGRSRFAGNEPSRFWVRNDRILQLACGDEHTALITESGRIFTFGLNEWGQLGLGDTTPRDKPSCIKDLKKEKAALVACGRTHTMVATESGQLYTFGSNSEAQLGVKDIDQHITPIQVNSFPPNTKFKMVAAGVDHSVCLTVSGIVYVWGGNSEGQLGTGNNQDKHVPTLLSVGEPVVAIAVGYYHTALLTEKGSVFIFGEVECGKLGLGDSMKSCNKPMKLSLGGDRIQSIACGGSHTVLLTDQKEVYTCGNGQNGQLGLGTAKQQISFPEKLNLSFKVTAICCGENHTAFLSDDGYLYTCGDGRYGKLGQGKDNYSNQFQPSRLLRFDPFIVDKVACGGCHMMVLAHHRSIPNGDTPDGVPKLNFDGNQTLLENPLDLSGTLSARDRRRQTADSSLSSLSRTLPSLSGATFSDHLQNSMSPFSEVRILPKLKNNMSLGPKPNIAEDGDKKEAKSTNQSNGDEQKSISNDNVQPLKSLSEIPKPKAAPRTLKPIEARNGHTVSESGCNDSVEENDLPVLDVAKKIEEKKVDDDHNQNIEEITNHKMSNSQTNGFSPRLSNGNAVSTDKSVVEEESTILLSEVKEKKKKKKKKVEKGKVKTKDKEKKKSKDPSEAKVETLESDESETEELESKGSKESEETKPKKTPKKLVRKKSKKEKDNEKKIKEEEEEEEEEDGEEEKENDTEKKDKKSRNSPSRKNAKTKEDEKLKGKKEEEHSEEDEEEDEEVNKKEKKKKKTKDGDAVDGDKEEAEGDPTDKMVFAEDLQTEAEKEEKPVDKKSLTCIIL